MRGAGDDEEQRQHDEVEKQERARPLRSAEGDVLGRNALMTKTLRPIGGVIRPISSSLTTTTPNHTRSKPYPSTSGTMKGRVRTRMPMESRNMPSTK